MKRFFFIFCMLCVAVFVSCEQLPTDIEEGEYITIPFSVVNASVTHADEPLETKSGETEYTYVIEAQQYNENTSKYEQYAHGIFDSSVGISIRVLTGRKYKFSVALFKDFFKTDYYLVASYDTYRAANNEFVYDEQIILDLHNGAFIDNPYTSYDVSHCETFFGTVDEYIASANGSVSVTLSRRSSLLELVVNGLTEGRITASEGPHFSLEYPNTTGSFWMTHKDYAKGNESFSTRVKFTYYPSDSDDGVVLVNQYFTFKYNYKKTITLNLSQSSSTESSSSFSITVSETELGTDEDSEFDCEV